MREKSTKKKCKSNFNNLIPEYDDHEIMEILKKRIYYQPEAAELAIKEAIKRELIHSEQDLFAEEFRVKPMRYGLFPLIEKEHQRNKIRKSIARGLVIAGILPIIWGFVRFNGGVKLEGSILVVLGFLWIFLSSRLFRRTEPGTIRISFVMLAVSVIYIMKLFISLGSIVFMDGFILVALYGLIVYGLLFLLRLDR
jgi:hypothetical protein